MKKDKQRTAVERINGIIDFIVSLSYVVGVEFTNDWYFNYRAWMTLIIIGSGTWLISYTFYVEFPTLKCVELCGGTAFTLMVRSNTVYSFYSFYLHFLKLEHCKIRRRCVQSQKVHVVVKFCSQSVQR